MADRIPYKSVLREADPSKLDRDTIRVHRVLTRRFGDKAYEVVAQRPRRVWITVPLPGLRPVLRFLKDRLKMGHVSTLTARDAGDRYEVDYFISDFRGAVKNVVVTVKAIVGHERPRIPTIISIYPGAELYERELQEFFGIEVVGHPDPRHLMLPEDWPEGNYPLRKDWTFEWEYATPDDLMARPAGVEAKEPEFKIKNRRDYPGGR